MIKDVNRHLKLKLSKLNKLRQEIIEARDEIKRLNTQIETNKVMVESFQKERYGIEKYSDVILPAQYTENLIDVRLSPYLAVRNTINVYYVNLILTKEVEKKSFWGKSRKVIQEEKYNFGTFERNLGQSPDNAWRNSKVREITEKYYYALLGYLKNKAKALSLKEHAMTALLENKDYLKDQILLELTQ